MICMILYCLSPHIKKKIIKVAREGSEKSCKSCRHATQPKTRGRLKVVVGQWPVFDARTKTGEFLRAVVEPIGHGRPAAVRVPDFL